MLAVGYAKCNVACRKAPADKAPQCLACEQTFRDPAQLPLAFLVTHSEDPRINVVLLTGICWRCAEKSDTELLKRGTELTAKFLKGRVYGRAPSSGRDQALSVQGQARFARFWLSGGVRPKGWTGLGGSFDRLPSVVVLELRGAQVAER